VHKLPAVSVAKILRKRFILWPYSRNHFLSSKSGRSG